MGCVSSTFLEDDDRRIIGVSTSHIVSLTSSTYGILTNLSDGPSSKSPPPPPPPPPPLSSTTPSRPKPAAAPEPQPQAEVINSWELMAGLLDPSTPAKSTSSCRDRDRDRDKDKDKARPPRCIRFPLRPIDGNTTRLPPPPHPTTDSAAAFERRCPPGGAHCAVLYTTTLRGVRATFEACNAVRAALQSHGVAFRERDVSMDRGFRDELRDLTHGLDSSGAVPRLFVRGRHVGGAEEVARLDKEGALGTLLEGLPRAGPGRCCCDGCGGMRSTHIA